MYEHFRRQDIENGIDYSINPLALLFHDRALEKRFLDSHIQNYLQLGRACHYFSVFFFCLFGLWDVLLIEPGRL